MNGCAHRWQTLRSRSFDEATEERDVMTLRAVMNRITVVESVWCIECGETREAPGAGGSVR